jgi:tRNA(Ile2)-agmatinylcytidine synthase
MGNKNEIENARSLVINTVEKYSDLENISTDPGIVIYKEEVIPIELTNFADRTIREIVNKCEALDLIRRFEAEFIAFKDGRGIIGALAAIGEILSQDHTYELITYRVKENRGTPRKVDQDSVFLMDRETSDLTFNNVDEEKGRMLITPRGPDPVLYGIRGESPEIVLKSYNIVRVGEQVESFVIFKTNQGTDAHLQRINKINCIRPFHSVIVVGSVIKKPRVIRGRHVIFELGDESGNIDCAAYEPTGKFRHIIKKFEVGDKVEVYGGVIPASAKHPMTINLEKVKILKLVSSIFFLNPVCPNCNRRMKSMGMNKGYKCKKCGYKDSKATKKTFENQRIFSKGIYMPPSRSQRHLSKPIRRYGKEKTLKTSYCEPIVDFWSLGR